MKPTLLIAIAILASVSTTIYERRQSRQPVTWECGAGLLTATPDNPYQITTQSRPSLLGSPGPREWEGRVRWAAKKGVDYP